MDVPLILLRDLARDQVVPWLARVRAGRRAALVAAGGAARMPCRLASVSRLELLDGASAGHLLVEPGTPALRFTGRRAGPEIEIPVGGQVVVVTGAEPDRFASRVGRTVTRYESVPGRPVWIETTAHDALLVRRALTAAPLATPAGVARRPVRT
ncbi:hypothetical protein [Kitasatospora paranensis]|uniref:Pyridoxamine 5'-phosphate oxidase n=1 Tax=Kitasatospora paranensis TaxID=258053 RepID=A0ABW2G0C8_9ACTN